MFWPVPPTSYPTQNIIYHWKSHGKEISKSPVSKNKQKILFIKYVSVLYIPLEIPYKENFNKSDKIWPTPPTSCPPQKLVPDTKMAKKWVLIKYGCVIVWLLWDFKKSKQKVIAPLTSCLTQKLVYGPNSYENYCSWSCVSNTEDFWA